MTRRSVRHPEWTSRRLAAVAPLAVAIAASAGAPGPARAQSDAPSAGDAELISRVDSIFAEHDRTDGPGCAVGVYRAGELVLARGYGMASLEHGLPITTRTAFDIGSISKQFTALAALLLERQGRLALDDDIRRYVPELPDYGPAITVRDLLQHTSGLRGYPALEELSGRRVATTEDLLDLLASQRALNFAPGSMHEYSHSDYELLGVVIERATGEPFGRFLEREVLQRLGMAHSRVHDARRLPIRDRAFAYSPSIDGFAIQFPASELVGGTGLYTSVEDLLHWDRNFYDGGLGGRELLDRLRERPTLPSGDTIPYAFGLQLGEYRGLPVVHRGGGGGFSTELMRLPEQRFAVATLCNSDAAHPLYLSRAVADLFLADDMQPPVGRAADPLEPVEAPPDEAGRYAGDYRPEDVPWNLLTLAAREGSLWEVFPDTTVRLTRLRDGRYHADGVFYAFSRPPDGAPLRLEVSWQEGAEWESEVLERIAEVERWRPDARALEAYTGTFHSPDLDVSWTLLARDERLGLRRRGASDLALTPVEPDMLTGMLGAYERPVYVVLRFGRDATGAVTHLEMSTPPGIDALRDLRFHRVERPPRESDR